MLISIVIPALNEAANIGRCVTSIQQHLPQGLQSEILVGDHGSTDDTAAIAVRLGAQVLSFRGGTVGGLRNRIVEKAIGSVLVFLDADTTVTAEWGARLEAVAAEVARGTPQITGSICAVPDSSNPFIAHWFAKVPRKNSSYLGTGHLIVSRALFLQVGGFDPALRSGEDYDFCMRAKQAGASIVVRPELRVVHHDYPLNAHDFLKREMWHGAGDFQSLARVLSSKVALSALFFIGLQIASLALLFVGWRYFLLAQLVSACAVIAQSFIKFRKLGFRGRCVNIGIFHLYLTGRACALRQALEARRRAAAR